MAQYTPIVRSLSYPKFATLLAAASRQSRETYFARHAVKAPKARGLPRAGAKNEARGQALYAALQQREDEELCEELLRSWLMEQRPLLCAAMDTLKIPHVDGLTESDEVKKIAELQGRPLQELVTALHAVAEPQDVAIYLAFMGNAAAGAPAASA